MRDKREFELRVREIATTKKQVRIKTIRKVTVIASGAVAACLVIGLMAIEPWKYIDATTDMKSESSYEPGSPNKGDSVYIEDSFNSILEEGEIGGEMNDGVSERIEVEIAFPDGNTVVINEFIKANRVQKWLLNTYADSTDEVKIDPSEEVYEFKVLSSNGVDVYRVSGEYITVNDGVWRMFSENSKQEFTDMIEDIGGTK